MAGAPLDEIAAHEADDGAVRAERLPDEPDLPGVTGVEWVVFADDSHDFHFPASFF